MLWHNQHGKLIRMTTQEKRHYKMFKAGKQWAVAGISLLFAGAVMMTKPAETHAATTPAKITTTEQTIATVQSKTAASKDGVLFDVQLAVGVKAPIWTAADFTTAAVAGQPDTYTVTLSSQGLAALQAANSTTKISAAQVKAGTLTVTSSAAQTKSQPVSTEENAAAAADKKAAATTKTPAQLSPEVTHSVSNGQPEKVTNLGDATQAQIDAAKAKATADYNATSQPQKVTAASSGPQTTGTATVALSATKVGYGSGLGKLTITYTMTNTEAGDDYTITLPVNSPVFAFGDYDRLAPAVGTSTMTTNADGTRTITNHFIVSQSGTTVQQITYALNPNELGQSSPMTGIGTSTVQVSYAVDGVAQSSQDIQVIISPQAHLQTPTRTNPTQATVNAVLPNTEYVYQFAVNENTGVRTDSAGTGLVNSAANYGTTVTIPTPAGFTLDAATTMALNQQLFVSNDTTTITQPDGAGGDVIISVPKGKGAQNFNDIKGYKLAGSFAVTQLATDQTLTAAGPAVMVQQIDDAGTTATFKASSPWTETIAGTNSALTVKGGVTADGNNSHAHTQLVLDNDPTNDPSVLNSFGFNYQAPAATSDATITLTIPDGLDATSVSVPIAGTAKNQYLPGTTEYAYTMTLADGTTETGTVAAGGTVKPQADSAIRTIAFKPNTLAPGATTDVDYSKGSFQVYGSLSAKYDDGTAVQNGDVLTSQIALTVPGTDAFTASVKQTVSTPVSRAGIYATNGNHVPGEAGGSIEVYGSNGNWGQTTNKIFEPILYYILPSATSVASVSGTQDAKVTQTLAADGRVIVTIDYTGTGESVDLGIGSGSNNVVKLNNNADAMPGSYPFAAYIYSPTTALQQKTPVPDPSLAGGHADAVVMAGSDGNWVIKQAATAYNSTLAQGDDIVPVTQATADKNSTAQLAFMTNMVNTTTSPITNVTVVANLPTQGDAAGSQYTFELTGAITLPTNFTTADGQDHPLNATVLYSTTPATLIAGSASVDLTGYISADQVRDWSTIRSVIIQMPTMPESATTGRIVFNGTIPNLVDQGNHTGYITSGFYMDGAHLSVENKKASASLTITGTSTIHARAHYVDDTGADKYVDFTDLAKTLKDNVDQFTDDYPATSDLSDADKALIPAGYTVVPNSLHIVDGGKNDGTATFGTTVVNAYDGDFAQYELVRTADLTVTYVDDDANGDTVAVPSTTPTKESGEVGDTGTYTVVVPTGYALASGQGSTVAYRLTADTSDNITVHLVHHQTISTVTTHTTTSYTGAPAELLPPAKTATVTWQKTTDDVTGTTIYTPSDTTPITVTTPAISGYKPDKAQTTYTPAESTTAPADDTQVVTYTAQPASLTVTYVDQDNDDQTVKTDSVTGLVGQTGSYTVQAPAGYDLASGQASALAYTLKADESDNLTVKLVHHKTTSTTTTQVTTQYTGLVNTTEPAQTENVGWNAVTDEITHTTTWTPVSTEPITVTTPPVAGFTPDVTATTYSPATTTTEPTDVVQTVTYTPDAHKAILRYVDDDDEGQQVGDDAYLTGTTYEQVPWTAQVPANYELASGQDNTGTYTFGTVPTDPANLAVGVTIHLVHKTQSGTPVTTQATVNYTGLPAVLTPSDHIQPVQWTAVTDLVTGVNTYTPQTPTIDAVTAPTVPGYTATPASVPGSTLTASTTKPTDKTATIQYTADAQTMHITYVDDVTGNTLTAASTTITGVTGQTGTYTAVVPTNYVLAKNQAATVPYTFAADDGANQLVIHLTHAFKGTTATTKRTITYTIMTGDQTKKPRSVVQSVTWNVRTDAVTGASVATPTAYYAMQPSPVLAGYTVDISTVAQEALNGKDADQLTNETVPVHYTADENSLTVTYIDDVTGKPIAASQETVSGLTDATGTYTVKVPQNYVLATGQEAALPYHITPDDTDNLTVHLTHAVKHGTASTKRIITYKVNGPAKAPKTVSEPVKWATTTDLVTGETIATANGAYDEVMTPTIAGYTPDQDSVAQQGLGTAALADLKDTTSTVTYNPDAQQINLRYVDDDDAGSQVGGLTPLSGHTDTTADWTATVPTGYALAAGQAANGTYTFKAADNQDIVIHLVHAKTTATVETTYSVTYTGLPSTIKPTATPQTVTWTATTDQATGQTVYAPDTATITAVTSPTIAGYTPDQTATPALTLTNQTQAPTDVNTTVKYTADPVALTVTYVDDVTGATVKTAQLTGLTDQGGEYTVVVPAGGYVLAKGQQATLGYTLAPDDTDNLTVHLTHGISHGTKTTHRTITYQVAGAKDAFKTVTQQVTWVTDKDQVTGETVATAQGAYDQVTSPTLAGYTPDQATVAQVGLGAVPAAARKDTNVVVTYTPDMQMTHVQYVDDDNDGKQVGSLGALSGRTDASAHWQANVPAGYALATGQAASGDYTFKAAANQNVVIHLVHAQKTATITTSYTVKYAGLPSGLTPKTSVQTADWVATTDEVTGKTVYVPQLKTIGSVKTPLVTGYAADVDEVPAITLTQMTQKPTDNTTTVTYHSLAAALKVTYVDDVTGKTVATDTINGLTGQTGQYAVKVPAGGYVLAKGQTAKPTYTLTPDDTDDFTVHLTHGITHGATTTSRTITYVVDGPVEAPKPVVQTIKWLTSTDDVSGETVATAQGNYTEVPSPTVPGYTASQRVVPQLATGATTAAGATAVIVTYSADTQNGAILIKTTSGVTLDHIAVTGPADSPVPQTSYQALLNALATQGYTIVSNSAAGASFDHDDAVDQVFTITLRKATDEGTTPEHPVSGGTAQGQSAKTTAETTTKQPITAHQAAKPKQTGGGEQAQATLPQTGGGEQTQATLPKTGEQQHSLLALLGALLLGSTALLGGKRRKQE